MARHYKEENGDFIQSVTIASIIPPSRRDQTLAAFKQIAKNVVLEISKLISLQVERGHDRDEIVVTMVLEVSRFGEAESVTDEVLESLVRRLSNTHSQNEQTNAESVSIGSNSLTPA